MLFSPGRALIHNMRFTKNKSRRILWDAAAFFIIL